MDTKIIEKFLLTARTKTYAGATGKSDSLLPGAVQYDYKEGELEYRDTYYVGNGIFAGLECVFVNGKPVWTMSYYGDFSQMSEDQADGMLRTALQDLWESTRLYAPVEKNYPTFNYSCEGSGTFDKVSGTELITVGGKTIYNFYYAGGLIG